MIKTKKTKPKVRSKIKKKVRNYVPRELLVGGAKITKESLTPDQQIAYAIFDNWFQGKATKIHGTIIPGYPEKPILRIGGAAGTGKSYLIRYIIEQYGFSASECYTMAYTGKAVNVLREDGILATTIHAATMQAIEEPVRDEDGNVVLRSGIPVMRTKFKPRSKLPKSVELLIMDEASFIPKTMESYCSKFKIPILEIGDPIQLPPVGDEQCFYANILDYFMTQTVRQKEGNEILDVATRLRAGKNIHIEQYHDNVLFMYQKETIEKTFFTYYPFFRDVDLVITSTNKQRQALTDLYREYIVKTNSPYPIAGERMICRKNNYNLMLEQYILTNGTTGISKNDVGMSLVDKRQKIYYMDFVPDVVANTNLYYPNLACDLEFLRKPFFVPATALDYKRPGEKFEFGYVSTAHLCQGSTVNSVLFVDSYYSDMEYLLRIWYTVLTRAKKRVYFLVPYTRFRKHCDMRNLKERLDAYYEQTGKTSLLFGDR